MDLEKLKETTQNARLFMAEYLAANPMYIYAGMLQNIKEYAQVFAIEALPAKFTIKRENAPALCVDWEAANNTIAHKLTIFADPLSDSATAAALYSGDIDCSTPYHDAVLLKENPDEAFAKAHEYRSNMEEIINALCDFYGVSVVFEAFVIAVMEDRSHVSLPEHETARPFSFADVDIYHKEIQI